MRQYGLNHREGAKFAKTYDRAQRRPTTVAEINKARAIKAAIAGATVE